MKQQRRQRRDSARSTEHRARQAHRTVSWARSGKDFEHAIQEICGFCILDDGGVFKNWFKLARRFGRQLTGFWWAFSHGILRPSSVPFVWLAFSRFPKTAIWSVYDYFSLHLLKTALLFWRSLAQTYQARLLAVKILNIFCSILFSLLTSHFGSFFRKSLKCCSVTQGRSSNIKSCLPNIWVSQVH